MSPVRVVRRRFLVRGTVQGVGFRPFVYGLAERLGLAGFVFNDGTGVVTEVEGNEDWIERFRKSLTIEAPPLAVVISVQEEQVTLPGFPSTTANRYDGAGLAGAGVRRDPHPRFTSQRGGLRPPAAELR